MPEFYTLGYGKWAAGIRWARFVATLKNAKVTTLVDIRHSPCPSQLDPDNSYGPRNWHLLGAGQGMVPLLRDEDISYQWAVELGNPQKQDPAMTILEQHLADPTAVWPVHRGVALAAALIHQEGSRCALMCACKRYADCHRKLIAETLLARLPGGTVHRDLTG